MEERRKKNKMSLRLKSETLVLGAVKFLPLGSSLKISDICFIFCDHVDSLYQRRSYKTDFRHSEEIGAVLAIIIKST